MVKPCSNGRNEGTAQAHHHRSGGDEREPISSVAATTVARCWCRTSWASATPAEAEAFKAIGWNSQTSPASHAVGGPRECGQSGYSGPAFVDSIGSTLTTLHDPFAAVPNGARHAALAELAWKGPLHHLILPTTVPAWVITGYAEARAALADRA